MSHLITLGFTQRLACRAAGLSRSTYHRTKKLRSQPDTAGQADKYADLRAWMRSFADAHRRWGYRRAWRKATQAGYAVGRDTFRRLWRQEGLRVHPRKATKRTLPVDPVPRTEPAQRPNDVWALDFQFDSDYHGKTIKICNGIDEFTREHFAYRVDRSVTAHQVIEMLDLAVLNRGAPRVVRMDNGPEFIAKALRDWVEEQHAIAAFIPPGQPWHNGFVESFHNRMRDELLEDNLFEDTHQARYAITWWSHRYNHEHPHSALDYNSPTEYAQMWEKQNTPVAA